MNMYKIKRNNNNINYNNDRIISIEFSIIKINFNWNSLHSNFNSTILFKTFKSEILKIVYWFSLGLKIIVIMYSTLCDNLYSWPYNYVTLHCNQKCNYNWTLLIQYNPDLLYPDYRAFLPLPKPIAVNRGSTVVDIVGAFLLSLFQIQKFPNNKSEN